MILGMNLPDNDEWTNSLLENDEAIAVDQDALGRGAVPVCQDHGAEIWVKDLADGSRAVGFSIGWKRPSRSCCTGRTEVFLDRRRPVTYGGTTIWEWWTARSV
jgi:hypothetical protein